MEVPFAAFRLNAMFALAVFAVLGGSSVPAPTLAKGFDIRGMVDCGRDEARFCRVTDNIYVWTEDLGGGQRKILVDFSWLLAEVPRLSQGEFIEIEIDDIEGALVVQRVIAASDPPPKRRRAPMSTPST